MNIYRVARFLKKCHNSDGGFGGGPQQMSHLVKDKTKTKNIYISFFPKMNVCLTICMFTMSIFRPQPMRQ